MSRTGFTTKTIFQQSCIRGARNNGIGTECIIEATAYPPVWVAMASAPGLLTVRNTMRMGPRTLVPAVYKSIGLKVSGWMSSMPYRDLITNEIEIFVV
jgi:hypothetical protein